MPRELKMLDIRVRPTPPKPSVTKVTHLLPFGALSPADFERLCFWLVEYSGYVGAQHLGAAGSDEGCDVIAYRKTDGVKQLWYFQCKRYKDISAAPLIREIEKYNKLVERAPKKKPFGVVFVTNAAISAKAREEVGKFCEQSGYDCEFWAHTELDLRVKRYQEIIDEFFNTPPRSRATSKRTKPTAYSGEREYRELMLESCNTIDLANLPNNDMFTATRRPDLCSLYVPQSVRVETGSATEVGRAVQNPLPRKEEHNGITIGNRLAESRRLVILGEPGSGKTTLIRWIATFYLLQLNRSPDRQKIPGKETLPRKDWLPIIVRGLDLDPESLSKWSLKQILTHVLCRAEISNAEAVAASFVAKLKDGKALLLIDGLDEITDLTARKVFCKQLDLISKANKKAHIIVTSRLVGYREMRYRIEGFEHLTLAEFSKEHKDEFASLWCDLSEPLARREVVKAELIRDIHSAKMERLTGNPLLLTAMALGKRRFDNVRVRKAELYWDLLEALLYSRHGEDEPLDNEAAIAQLEYLAYEMCDRGVQRLLRTEVIELLEKMQTEYPRIHAVQERTPVEFLGLLERRTGILTVTGHVRRAGMPVSEYEFRHPVFREYLAARALVESRTPGRNPKLSLAQNVSRLAGRTETRRIEQSGKGDVAITENWREVLRLCVASCADTVVKDVLLAILKPMKGQTAKTTARPRAVLAALCLADEPNVTDEVAREVLRRFVREIGLNDGNHYGTSVDNAVRELASSQWAGKLQEALDRELKNRVRRSDESHYNVASLGLLLRVERQ